MSDTLKIIITLLSLNIALVIACAVLTVQNIVIERKLKLLQAKRPQDGHTKNKNRRDTGNA